MNAAFESTLIRRGLQATTISELTRFVESMDARPLDRLLDDLPGLALLSTSKFDLARAVFKRRARQLSDVEREQLRIHAEDVAADHDPRTAERIRALFG